MKSKKLNWLRNPLVTLLLLILANLVSFTPSLQDPFFFMFGVLGNFFLTFTFAFLIMTTALNLDRVAQTKFFKYVGYLGIGIYYYLYTTWIFSVHPTFSLGYIILAYGVYTSFQVYTGRKKLTKKILFSY